MPLIIGVTGSIASGKSTACKLLECRGAVHCDADKLVHKMYDPGKPAFHRIIEEFGESIVGGDGYIDRKILGSKVFGDPDSMNRLTDAIGDIKKEVSGVMMQWKGTLSGDDIALMEAVNFVEAGYGVYSDLTWLFAVETETAITRLMKRNDLSEEDANRRILSQKDWRDRAAASDLITHNDGDLESFKQNVLSTLDTVLRMYKSGSLKTSKYRDWWNSRQSN